MFFVTGDTHGGFDRIIKFCESQKLTDNDVIIILGDAGINYYCNHREKKEKQLLSKSIQANLFCVHGNHEQRPEAIETYHETTFFGGKAYVEEDLSNLIFAKDGEIYTFDKKQYLVIGGAYSVDKEIRLLRGLRWFENEQPSLGKNKKLNVC